MRIDRQFMQILEELYTTGETIETRNSKVKRIIGSKMVFTTTPLVSIRRTAWKKALLEMEWFLSGSENVNDLDSSVHPWWKPWMDKSGIVKNNYSKQFRRFEGGQGSSLDQISTLVDEITNHPFSRRMVITTWNPFEMRLPETPITNCHGTTIQTFVNQQNELTLLMYQRSGDYLLGVPHNLIQYWALLLWLGKQTGTTPAKFIWIGGDVHLYDAHNSVALEMVAKMQECEIVTPELGYTGQKGDPFRASDFQLQGMYKPVLNTNAVMVV